MDTSELLKKVKKIEIKSRSLSHNIFAGVYHAAFKGRGVMFSEVREYQPGDDVRDIDWNVTARQNKPFVKVYEEDRELTMMLLIDVSASEKFGSSVSGSKRDMMAEIAATLAFSSIANNDKVGVIFFSDRVEKFIPPKKGKSHILLIIREILNLKPVGLKTDINMALEFLNRAVRKRCSAFLLSDFIDDSDYYNSMSVANRKHELAALQVFDERDTKLPDVGLVRMADLESGKEQWVDTSSAKVRNLYEKCWYENRRRISLITARCGVEFFSVRTDGDYVKMLLEMFRRRSVK